MRVIDPNTYRHIAGGTSLPDTIEPEFLVSTWHACLDQAESVPVEEQLANCQASLKTFKKVIAITQPFLLEVATAQASRDLIRSEAEQK